jgi:hypothetical protein
LKTDWIRMVITDIIFIFIFLSRFAFEYAYCQLCRIGSDWISTS